MSDGTLGRARGLNSIADPAEFKGSRGRSGRTPLPAAAPPPERPRGDAETRSEPTPVTPHRAVVPGLRRKRRELSVPIPVAEAVEATGINPADVVMSAYRNHSDAIFAGSGGRMMARGRQRLRLSISDAEFDKITRLGEARGWNRSETVAVLLTVELLGDETPPVVT